MSKQKRHSLENWERQTPLVKLTTEELETVATEAFEAQQSSEQDPSLKLINERLDACIGQGGYHKRFLTAIASDDWRLKVPRIAKEYFDTLHHLDQQKRFLCWYGQAFSDLVAQDSWYANNITRIAFLENGTPASTTKKSGTAKLPAKDSANSKSKPQRCAEDVVTIEKQLHHLRAIQLPEDYERFKAENPGYLTFKIVKNNPLLRDKITNLSERKGRLLGLAQELVALHHKIALNTVKVYWKKRNR